MLEKTVEREKRRWNKKRQEKEKEKERKRERKKRRKRRPTVLAPTRDQSLRGALEADKNGVLTRKGPNELALLDGSGVQIPE